MDPREMACFPALVLSEGVKRERGGMLLSLACLVTAIATWMINLVPKITTGGRGQPGEPHRD